MTSPRHAAVLLAAGESRRLGQPKQLLAIDGEPLVRRAARAALATAPSEAVIVVGAQAAAVWSAVADLPLVRVDCADWAAGLSASLCAGLQPLDPAADGVLVVLCDQPALDAAHLCALVATWRSQPQLAAASAYSGILGVPAVLPRGWVADLQALTGDVGARDLLRSRAGEVLSVHAPSLALDVDDPADLERSPGLWSNAGV